MLQSGYCGAGDNLPVDFQFVPLFCSLFHLPQRRPPSPGWYLILWQIQRWWGILGGLINGFPSCQYCCVDIASHSTSPISLDRDFHSCKICAGLPVSELVRCILMLKSSFAYSNCIPSISTPLVLSYFLLLCLPPSLFHSSPIHPSFLFITWCLLVYLFILHAFTTLRKRRDTGKLGEVAKTHCIVSIWHETYCSEPPGHATVTHFYPRRLLSSSSSFHPPSLLLSLAALWLNPVCGLTVILAVWVTGSLVWYLKGRKTDQRLFT